MMVWWCNFSFETLRPWDGYVWATRFDVLLFIISVHSLVQNVGVGETHNISMGGIVVVHRSHLPDYLCPTHTHIDRIPRCNPQYVHHNPPNPFCVPMEMCENKKILFELPCT